MPLDIENEEVERLARQKRFRDTKSTEQRLKEIARSCAELPVHDYGSDEDIVAYDLNGLPSSRHSRHLT
ncbi:hypothetical protein FRD01_22850 [Microvenator marinus]|uniref:Uncharacterized protein n=1 Tax=Microvenator marinus TaxID=2600177 RepID=A0A5B8XWT8_9DELT|nr:type II toxin-antitoxin system VapB family antitoxin [Microvenator marinus]QED30020.1 hypothetical protein FRD01_22850 [Microvenator marinus]